MATETVAQAITDIRKEFPNMRGVNNEEETKQFVIERILRALDWDQALPREVKKEYPVSKDNKDKVDYALNPNLLTMVFVEAKAPGVNFDNKPVQQLLKYCFQEAVNLAVLTDGRRWWLYLPDYKGPQGENLHWSKKRFSEIDIIDETIDGERRPKKIPTEFERFLAKDKVSSGEAVEAGKSIIDDRMVQQIVENGMRDAWNNILTAPSQELIKLLTESTADQCGVKPSKKL